MKFLATDLPDVDFFTISCDLPTGMARFCGAEGINQERVRVLSDHQDVSFGRAYGTLIPSLRIECRAVFVLDCLGGRRRCPDRGDRPRGGGGPPLDVRSNGGLSCDREKAPIDDKDAANGRSTV